MNRLLVVLRERMKNVYDFRVKGACFQGVVFLWRNAELG